MHSAAKEPETEAGSDEKRPYQNCGNCDFPVQPEERGHVPADGPLSRRAKQVLGIEAKTGKEDNYQHHNCKNARSQAFHCD